MLESWPIELLVGTVLGFLSGLGVGGGSLLILWLTLVLKMPQAEARGINLLFFLPSAALACLFRWKQGTLPLRTVLPAAIGGCAAAFLGNYANGFLDVHLLKKFFGILLLLTGVREICWKQKHSPD